jgi:hypothetical protein
VIGALRPIADGRSPLRAVKHPLGFTCLPVERAGRDGVCVHLWSPRIAHVEPTTSPIHAHCWNLISYALFGELENMLMRVADVGVLGVSGVPGASSISGGAAPEGPDVYRMLEVRSHGDVDELRPTPRLVRCVPRQRQLISAGDVYSMSAGEFHTTEVGPGAETATVALGRMAPGAADCSLGALGAAGHRVRRHRCDAAQTAEAARIVLDRLLTPTARPA